MQISIEKYGRAPYKKGMVKSPRQPQDKFIIRLPDGMRDQIGVAARANKRTMTGEIIDRLEKSFRDAPPLDGPIDLVAVVKETLDDHEKRLAKLEARSKLEDAPFENTLELQAMQLRNMLKKDE